MMLFYHIVFINAFCVQYQNVHVWNLYRFSTYTIYILHVNADEVLESCAGRTHFVSIGAAVVHLELFHQIDEYLSHALSAHVWMRLRRPPPRPLRSARRSGFVWQHTRLAHRCARGQLVEQPVCTNLYYLSEQRGSRLALRLVSA